MPDKIENIIFDLGGVLINWSPKEIAANTFSDPALQQRVIDDVFGHQDWYDMDKGLITEEEIVNRIAARLDQSHDTIKNLIDQVRISLTTKYETVELLYECNKNHTLYCLSNIHTNNFNCLSDRNEFFKEFKDYVVSAQVKMMKPDADIYLYTLKKFDIDAAKTIFIDDSPANVNTANKLGITGILFTTAQQCRDDLVKLGVLE